ncbi:unnamed protein product [Durusdinium trenchii]|uniref:Pentatricopeptide repeat-containing protein-mitochondrial domain-containing protein n=2 Tax=Durusdinium trenchii TaxID=1381693 RepID=A0ABP0M531_9DINO
MKRAIRSSLIGILIVLWQGSNHQTFALPKQPSSYFVRQRQGFGVHAPAGERLGMVVNTNTTGLILEPSQEEKTLASQLKAAGNQKNGRWQQVYAKYSGFSPLVLTAAMQAALKQGDYEEGYKIYKRVIHMTLPTYTIAMKLLGKLGRQDEVERLWGQLVEQDLVGQLAAGGRIDAAASIGDIQAAEQVLDYMKAKGIEANVVHFTSAINACANSDDTNRAKAAQRFLDAMLTAGLMPNTVTYGALLRALQQEPKHRLQNLLVEMKGHNVRPDTVFVECFLFTLLNSRTKGEWRRRNVIVAHLRKLPFAHLQAAKHFIDEMRDTKVRLAYSSRLIDAALREVLG